MRLRQQLEAKRDYHLGAAGKYQELITFLDGDGDLMKVGHRHATTIMAQARALANSNGNGHAAPTKAAKPHGNGTPAARRAQSRRMKLMWKHNRAKMLKGVRKGGLAAAAAKRTRTREATT